jgi:hypothetical protein
MLLSQHFSQSEMERDAPLPPECVPVFTMICERVLEPIRAHVGQPLIITSAYRPPAANAAAHGVANSQHIATASDCAVDFSVGGVPDLRALYDWIRLKSGLPIDQLILEHNPGKSDIVHVSYVIEGPRREALEGEVANLAPYKHAPFNSPEEAANQAWPQA